MGFLFSKQIDVITSALTNNSSQDNMFKFIGNLTGIISGSKPTITHKRGKIPSSIRNSVWRKYHKDKDTGECYTCGNNIQRYNAGWHCSHVIADSKNGLATIENLRTCCGHCNLSMGDQNLYAYISEKQLRGPGSKNINNYFKDNPSQINDKRTNNWGKKSKQ